MEYYHSDPESMGSKFTKLFLRVTNRRMGFERQVRKGDFSGNDVPLPPGFIRRQFSVEKSIVKGRNVFTIAPAKHRSDKTIVYLHGGGYVQNSMKQHWQLLRQLILATGCRVVIPDYPLAPASTYREAIDLVESVYRDLIARIDPQSLILMGDSAGGGLALALAQKMKLEQIPQPGRIILIAPWLDFTLSNPAIDAIESLDPLLDRQGLLKASRKYAGDTDPNHYQLSPINGSLEGLGNLSLFIGTHDILYPDVVELKTRLTSKGIEVNYYEFPKMVHDWVVLTFLKESAAAISLMKQLF